MRKHTNIQLEKLFKTLFREFESAVCKTEQAQPGTIYSVAGIIQSQKLSYN